MKVNQCFSKDIFRPINGVIKAEQRDEASVCQELEEFVVTRELRSHLDKFFSAYYNAIEEPDDPDIASKIGIWVSGFFGSGKSHFIKALSYLFENREIQAEGYTKTALKFFEDKIDDQMLLSTVKQSVEKPTDTVLFNIDSKADQKKGREAILDVFLKVLNELQGFSPDYPHIAHMERYLHRKGELDKFKDKYNALTGNQWINERDSYMFNQDQIVEALSQTLGQSKDACSKWIDNAQSDFSLTVENFAQWTKEYLDQQGQDHRIIFLVDEIGQFIGGDGHLMLSLQTIVENLGVVCGGRAWVVVTAQEDIDTVLGSLSSVRTNDFSKIQGRFKTRLSLSSANVDEVIQARLLDKTSEAEDQLKLTYEQNKDVLKNQLTFSDAGMTLKSFDNPEDFTANYPFIPYQFQLIQKVFESIRRAGATGLHLARGERSMLNAFQEAGQKASKLSVGILVPLHWFYPSIESFLDTTVKRTIEQAGEKPKLEKFDISVLQILFMIRYVDELKGNIDNLVTLCIDHIDADRFDLREKIEAALHRMESETLVGRSGEEYFFLTNEERDISREIKNEQLEFGDESIELGKIIFQDIYDDLKKHRYSVTGKDISLNRMCDMKPLSGRIEEGLTVSVITPFFDDYPLYNKSQGLLQSSEDEGQVLICLPDNENLRDELQMYLKTEKYLRRKDTSNPEVSRILDNRKEQNRQRREQLISVVKEMLTQADYYVAGQQPDLQESEPLKLLSESLDYLVENTFSKMGYIEHPCENPQKEMQSVLAANDIGQQSLDLNLPRYNPKAVAEVRQYLDLCTKSSKQVVLKDLVEGRFSNRPYGWPERETMLLLARMYMAGEIYFVMNGATVEQSRLYEALTKVRNWRKIIIKQRKKISNELLETIRKLGQDLFGQTGPENQEKLFNFFTENLTQWKNRLAQYQTLAQTGNYPGLEEIQEGINLINVLLDEKESYSFFQRVNDRKDELLDFVETFQDIDTFYTSQRKVWDRLRSEYEKFKLNSFELKNDKQASKSLARMEEILKAAAPYRMLSEADSLISTVKKVNNNIISTEKESAHQKISNLLEQLKKELKSAGVKEDYFNQAIDPLLDLDQQIESTESVAHLREIPQRAQTIFDEQINKLQEYLKEQTGQGKPKTTVKSIKVIKSSQLTKKEYLETQQDVEEFIERLRKQMTEAVEDNNRIRIE